jgi:hypothetical protein
MGDKKIESPRICTIAEQLLLMKRCFKFDKADFHGGC